MKVIYVAGPYRASDKDGIEANIQKAKNAAMTLWRHGWAVICPHANTAHFDGIVTDKNFLDGDLEILRRCDAVSMVRGWQKSAGATNEFKVAQSLGLEVIYETDTLDTKTTMVG